MEINSFILFKYTVGFLFLFGVFAEDYSVQKNITQHAGYFQVDESNIHYVFAESENDPLNDPIIVWFEGELGCSNLWMFFNTIGPHTITETGLIDNPYTWSSFSNILVFDAIGGTGYSYPENKEEYDAETIAILFEKVFHAFFNDFPDFQKNPIYLAGSGKAAIFLAEFLTKVNISEDYNNFKGLILADGEFSVRQKAITDLIYTHSHGLFGHLEYEMLYKNCCNSDLLNCVLDDVMILPECSSAIMEAYASIRHPRLNPFNIYADCEDDSYGFFEMPDTLRCIDEGNITIYLNSQRAHSELNVSSSEKQWFACGRTRFLTTIFDITDKIQQIIGDGLRVFIYAGDSVPSPSFLHSQRFANKLRLEQTRKLSSIRMDEQTVGFHSKFKTVDYVTILKGGKAGYDKANIVQHIISSFIRDVYP